MATRFLRTRLFHNLRRADNTSIVNRSLSSASAVSPLNLPDPEPEQISSSVSSPVSSTIDISDHKKLFASVGNTKLLKSAVNLHLASVESVVDAGTWVMNSRLMEVELAREMVLGVVKRSFYEHFCAGESGAEVERCIAKVNEAGLRAMLVYASEHTDVETECLNNLQGFLHTVKSVNSLPPSSVSFVIVKISAICRMSLLTRVSDLLRWQQRDPTMDLPWKQKTLPIFSNHSPIYHTQQKPQPLSHEEQTELELAHQRLLLLCEESRKANVRIAVDAEDTIIQPAIDYMTYSAALMYNKDGDNPVVYNTIQAYLKDAKDRLYLATKAAERMNVSLGLKLVRGAYIVSERKLASSLGFESPVHDTIQDTHDCYNACTSYMLDRVANGTGSVVLATHNVESGQLAAAKAGELGIDKENPRLDFAQLYGMSEALSFGLVNAGFRVSKYMPYGPVQEIIPYLLRRAEENRGFLAASSLDRKLMRMELQRRFKAAFV